MDQPWPIWDEAREVLEGVGNSDDEKSEHYRALRAQAAIVDVDAVVDASIIEWSKTYLVNATTDRQLITYQAMVIAIMQLRNKIVGKIVSGGPSSNG